MDIKQSFLKATGITKQITNSINKWFRLNEIGAVKGNNGRWLNNKASLYEAYSEEAYVYGCTYLISNTIASIPLKIYTDETKTKEIKNHQLYELMKRPNFIDSMYDIKEKIAANLLLDGNAFLQLNAEGTPENIFALTAPRVMIIPNKVSGITKIDELIKGYAYGSRNEANPLTLAEVIHEKLLNMESDLRGMSPLAPAALNIALAQNQKMQNYNMTINGVKLGGSFESDEDFSQQAYDRLKEDLKAKHSGTEKAHLPYILFSGLKYKDNGISARDIEFIQGLKLTREELCGFIYQVPIILLGILENASYNNIKEAQKIFYNFSIIPRLVKNRELYQKLADRYGQACYIDFDLSNIAALKEEVTDRIKNVKELWTIGVPMSQLNTTFELGLQAYPGWDKSYIPFGLVEGSNEPQQPDNSQEDEGGAGDQGNGQEKAIIKINKIEWTAEKKEAKWKVFDAIARKHESKYQADMVPFFKRQRDAVIARLNKYKSITTQEIENNKFVIVADDGEVKKAINLEAVLFDKDTEIVKLKKISLPAHRAVLKEQAQHEFKLLGIDTSFNINNPKVTRWLEHNALDKATSVTGTITDKLKDQIIAGINEGESIVDITNRLKEVYTSYTELRAGALETIARTEIIGASNQGSLEAYTEAGVDRKGWLATHDTRVRDTHLEAEAKYSDGIPLDEDFEVGDGSGPAPCQIDDPAESINCRCAIYPIIEK